MHGPINAKSPNNTSKWQTWFNSAFKGLKKLKYVSNVGISMVTFPYDWQFRCKEQDRILPSQYCCNWRSLEYCCYVVYHMITKRPKHVARNIRFFFPHGATAPSGASSLPRHHDHTQAHLVFVSFAKTSNWQHTTLTRDGQQFPWRDSKPHSQQADPRLTRHGHWHQHGVLR
jgi:hypothetical protein